MDRLKVARMAPPQTACEARASIVHIAAPCRCHTGPSSPIDARSFSSSIDVTWFIGATGIDKPPLCRATFDSGRLRTLAIGSVSG
jgi:hypothetical protein